MTRAGGGLLLAAVLAVGACAAGSKLDTLDSQLGTLSRENTDASRTKLAAMAGQAQEDAKSSDGLNRVAFYRVAAVAAWRAGTAGQSLVLPITDEGIAACDALERGNRPLVVDDVENDRRAIHRRKRQRIVEIAFRRRAIANPARRDPGVQLAHQARRLQKRQRIRVRHRGLAGDSVAQASPRTDHFLPFR